MGFVWSLRWLAMVERNENVTDCCLGYKYLSVGLIHEPEFSFYQNDPVVLRQEFYFTVSFNDSENGKVRRQQSTVTMSDFSSCTVSHLAFVHNNVRFGDFYPKFTEVVNVVNLQQNVPRICRGEFLISKKKCGKRYLHCIEELLDAFTERAECDLTGVIQQICGDHWAVYTIRICYRMNVAFDDDTCQYCLSSVWDKNCKIISFPHVRIGWRTCNEFRRRTAI